MDFEFSADKELLRATLRRFLAEPGRTIVIATHEAEWFAGLDGRVVRMDAGRVAA